MKTIPDLIANEPETVDLIEHPPGSGYWIVRATWRNHVFDVGLPRYYNLEPGDKPKQILRDAARKAKEAVAKAKWRLVAEMASQAAALKVQVSSGAEDEKRQKAASEKRERRAARKLALVKDKHEGLNGHSQHCTIDVPSPDSQH